MDKINVTFCGQKQLCLSKADHKTLMNNLKTEFLKLFETYKEENIVFYFGGNDGLSAKAFAALSEMKHEFKYERIYVSTSPVEGYTEFYGYDRAVFPFDANKTGWSHKRRRNEWLVSIADILFAYKPVNSVTDAYMLECAEARKQIMDKPEIFFVTSR